MNAQLVEGRKKGRWGVKDGRDWIWQPDFSKPAAERLLELEQQVHPPDWEAAKEILIAEGLMKEGEYK